MTPKPKATKPRTKVVKAVKAWALQYADGSIDTSWITNLRHVQTMRVDNNRVYLKRTARVVRVLISIAPSKGRGK